MKMRRGEPLSPNYAELNAHERHLEVIKKTVWDFCQCPAELRLFHFRSSIVRYIRIIYTVFF